MSYSQPRSRGCHACRAMKVKCDQTLPQCQRCLNAGRLCPGYRGEADLIFRDMNQATEEKVQTRIQESLIRRVSEGEIRSLTPTIGTPGAGPSAHTAMTNPGSGFFGGGLSLDPLGSVPVPLSPDWQTQVSNNFLSEFTFRSDLREMSGGHLEYLADLCREESRSQCLREALDAVSFAHVAAHSSLSWLTLRARQSYGKALVSLTATLRTADAQKDGTLATVILMSMYEMISGEKPQDKVWDSHSGGREFLLRLRGLQQFESERGKSLFRNSYTQMSMSALSKCRELPDESNDWLNCLEQNPSTHLAMCIYKLSRVRAAIPELLVGDLAQQSTRQRLVQHLHHGISMDEELQSWSDRMSEPYRYMELIIADAPRQRDLNLLPMQPANVHVYHDIWVASLWNHYRFARIRLLETLVDCESRLGSPENPEMRLQESSSSLKNWNKTIVKMVDDICASVPFLMGDIDVQGNLNRGSSGIALGGYYLLWPLHIASSTRVIGADQKVWIKGRLRHLGTVMGINQAHLLAAMV